MVERNIIGDNVRRIRKEQNITQEELTAKLQIEGLYVDRPMVTRIELKKKELLDYELLCIAKVLRVSIDQLFKK